MAEASDVTGDVNSEKSPAELIKHPLMSESTEESQPLTSDDISLIETDNIAPLEDDNKEKDAEEEECKPRADSFIGESTLFDNIFYLGRAVIGSAVSNVEANAIIGELSAYQPDTRITLSIANNPGGNVEILDAETKLVLYTDPVRSVLYCTKSGALPHCFAFTSGNKERGIYYCHAFQCKDVTICMKILHTMGTTFNRGIKEKQVEDASLIFQFEVTMEVLESNDKTLAPVPQDKDCFKLRKDRTHHIHLTILQLPPSTMIVERCCGLFLAPSHDPSPNQLLLLDMPVEMETGTTATGPLYIVKGVWDPVSQPCSWLNNITAKGEYQDVTVAIDLVASGVQDPIRFTRKTRIKVFDAGERFYLYSRYLCQQTYTVELGQNAEDPHRRFALTKVTELEMEASPSKLKTLFSGLHFGADEEYSDSTNDSEDEEPLISGTAQEEEINERAMKSWRDLLDSWTDSTTRPPGLVKLARKGIPNTLRGEVWMKLAGLTKDQIEDKYTHVYNESMLKECRHEQVILWDLNRTFPGNDFFKEGNDGQRRLYHVCKSYAGQDPEVGYCQGLSFVVAVLLLHLEETEAFALFSVIMSEYQFRDLFKKGFQMLQLKFYILEKMIEELIPELREHFIDYDINTQMYASQWFLTLFSAKFPLMLVYRIVDMFLTEGPDTLFKIGIALLKMSRTDLLSQDFEGMLKYFRVSLPRRYMEQKQGTKLLSTAHGVKVNPAKLAIWEAEFHQIQDEKRSLEDPIRQVEHQLKQAVEANHRLEQENDMLVQRLMMNQVNMRHQMDELEKRNLELKRDLSRMNKLYEETSEENKLLGGEIVKTKNLYHSALVEGDEERTRHHCTIKEYTIMCKDIESRHDKEKAELNQEVIEIKAQLGGEEVSDEKLSSEQRLRELEMELARTKLCLVEANCKAQEYEHRNTNLHDKLKVSESSLMNQFKAKLNR